MDKILEMFDLQAPGALKRALTFIIGTVSVIAAPQLSKLGVSLDDTQIASVAGVIAAYLIQSGVHSAAKQIAGANSAGEAEADEVKTVEDAKKVVVP